METKIGLKALRSLKLLYSEILQLQNHDAALTALHDLADVVESYVIMSFAPEARYTELVKAIIFTWVVEGDDSPEALIEELKANLK